MEIDDEWSVTKMAFNPSETVLYILLYDHYNGGSGEEYFCSYILTTENVICAILDYNKFMQKSEGTNLVIFDDFIVLSGPNK